MTFQWKNSTRWRRKNYDIHKILGFYSLLLAIVIAFTGLIWSFAWLRNSVDWIANGGEVTEPKQVKVVSALTQPVSVQPIDVVHGYVKRMHQKAEENIFILPTDSLGTIRVFVRYKSRINDVLLEFNRYNGKLLSSKSWKDKTNGEKLFTYNFDIHTGTIGGIVGKTIVFFISLISASLPVSGFLIWWGRKFKKRKPPLIKKIRITKQYKIPRLVKISPDKTLSQS